MAIIACNCVRPSALCAQSALRHQLHQLRLRGGPTEGRAHRSLPSEAATRSTESTWLGAMHALHRDHWDHSSAGSGGRRIVARARSACARRSFRYRAHSLATIRPPPREFPDELGTEVANFFGIKFEVEPQWPFLREKRRLRSAICAAAMTRLRCLRSRNARIAANSKSRTICAPPAAIITAARSFRPRPERHRGRGHPTHGREPTHRD